MKIDSAACSSAPNDTGCELATVTENYRICLFGNSLRTEGSHAGRCRVTFRICYWGAGGAAGYALGLAA
jgi:hypothetical protein